MNKLDGFFRLKELSLPTVPFKIYEPGGRLSPDRLWTLRTALYEGHDFALPRAVGVSSKEGEAFASKYEKEYSGKGIIIYYPYFVASKSGTLLIRSQQSIIEGVKGDLWHLVSEGKKEMTWFMGGKFIGNASFLNDDEKKELEKQESKLRRIFYEDLAIGKEVLLEWSFAHDSDFQGQAVGEAYLVFYELRVA